MSKVGSLKLFNIRQEILECSKMNFVQRNVILPKKLPQQDFSYWDLLLQALSAELLKAVDQKLFCPI